MMRLGIVGAGNMGEALLAGLIKAGLFEPAEVMVSDVREERLTHVAARYHVKTTRDNREVVRECETVVLAVKPPQVGEVLSETGDEFGTHHLLITMAAGIPISAVERKLPLPVPVIRVMPNTPAMVQETAAAIALGTHATPAHGDSAVLMFNAIGEAMVVDEGQMDAVTAVSGSGPAYVFLMVEALTKAGVAEGLSEDAARSLAVQTAYGASAMLSLTMEDAAELRKRVASPGGTTEAALKVLNEKRWSEILIEAVHAARVRAEEMAEQA
jgi:pyrroline-5-carboxylate reductase